MSADADIVVAGAGHNSLIAACYLAKAGYRCLVLDARDIPGGGSTTEEQAQHLADWAQAQFETILALPEPPDKDH